MELAGIKVAITVEPSGGVELTNSAGQVGGVANGNVVTQAAGTHTVVGTYSVTNITFKQSDDSALSTDQKAFLAGHTLTFTDCLSATGMVKIVDTSNSNAVKTSDTLAVVLEDDFDGTYSKVTSATFTYGSFMIRTNNDEGTEYVLTSGINASKGTPIPLKTSATDSDLVCYVDATGYQIQKRANKDAAWADSEGDFLHEADGLAMANNNQAAIS